MFAGISINWWAVIVGGLLQMVTGMIWYNPKFPTGKMWMDLNKFTEDGAGKDNMGMMYGLMFVAALVMAYVLALFVSFFHAHYSSTGDLYQLAFWIWFGFFVAGAAGIYLFPPKPFKLFALDSVYKLINILILVWLFTAWK